MKNKDNKKQTERTWHLIDVKGKVLGRIATQIAELLMGKKKPIFTRYKDIGDNVVIINCAKVIVTGKKKQQKTYIHHTGYPGGFRKQFFWEVHRKDPRQIIIHAVKGMLPQNKLRDKMLKRLYVFPDEKHPFKDKIKLN